MKIEGSVGLVTGGSSGLGEAVARMLVENGGRVAIVDMQEEVGGKLAAELGSSAIFTKADVTDEESVQKAVNTAMERFGMINVVVNSAGTGTAQKVLGKNGPVPLALFNKVIQVNLVGTLNVIRLALEKMVENAANEHGERGVIVNVSSGAAFDGQIGQAAYSASKGGVVSMTLPLAREFASYGIRVVSIAPGMFDTPMFAGLPDKVRDSLISMSIFPKRMGLPCELGMIVRQIVENPMLNGTTIRIDGAVRMQAK